MSGQQSIIIAVIFGAFWFGGCSENQHSPKHAHLPGYRLVWADEFDVDSVKHNWTPQVGDGTAYGIPTGWGNNELQYYTGRSQNAFIKDGKLVIQALEEDYKGHKYTCARLRSIHKYDFLYGKVEARIKLPSSQGMWPAFWMMPTDSEYGGWAASGEIDILEAVNKSPTGVMGSIFFGGQSPQEKVEHISRFYRSADYGQEVDLAEDFHIYGFEWQPYEMRWSVDGRVYSVQNDWHSTHGSYPAPFDKAFHFLLNIAIGGNGPGAPDETTTWPQRMAVDWIRVYQSDNKPPHVKIVTPANENKLLPDGAITIRAETSDPDGDIGKIEFYVDNKLIGEDTTAPYSYIWTGADGCYTFKVRVVDNEDFARTDSVKAIKGIGCPQRPFGASPAKIPGRIETENFDAGPPGDAYFDRDASNRGGVYRRDSQVDIGVCDEGGYSLGWMYDGEWMEYTVDVTSAGKFDIIARVSSLEGAGKFGIKFDGVDKTGTLSAPKTGGWQTYTDLTVQNVELAAGEQIMRIFITEDGFNLNYIDIVPSK